MFLRARPLVFATTRSTLSRLDASQPRAASAGRDLCSRKGAPRSLAAWHGQAGIRCRKHRFVVVIRQSREETANSAKRLTQEQIGGGVIRRSRVAVSAGRIEFRCPSRLRTQVEANRSIAAFAIRSWTSCISRIGSRYVMSARLTAKLKRQINRPSCRASPRSCSLCTGTSGTRIVAPSPVLSSGPRFAHPIARRFHHRVVNFLELHARPAHSRPAR